MSEEPRQNDEDEFAAKLAAYDAALLAGQISEEDTVGDEELRCAKSCLDELEAMWPRRNRSLQDTRIPLDTHSESVPTERLGRFELIRELGRGGGGVVYLAYDPTLQRQVALKVPRPESVFTPELRRRFLREAKVTAQLNHRNILPVFEAGESAGICYLVSAYCPGPNLSQWLHSQSGPAETRANLIPSPNPMIRHRESPHPHGVSPRHAAMIVAALADGAAHMHSRGVLHRDIKPTNVLLEFDEGPETYGGLEFVPRLTDFGLAKLDASKPAASDTPNTSREHTPARFEAMTRTGAIIGTPAYMAPEQAEGRLDRFGPPTDVYSLGVVLYELLAGQPPFRGATDMDTLRRLMSEDPLPLRRRHVAVPRDLESICLKCMAKCPTDRYPTAEALALDLRCFLEGRPTLARPQTAVQVAVGWARRRPAAAVALLGLVALLLMTPMLVWYMLRLANVEEVARVHQLYRLLSQVKERRMRHPAGWTWENLHDLRSAALLNPPAENLPLLRTEVAAALAAVDIRRLRSLAPGFLAHEAAFTPDGKYLILAQGIGDSPEPMRVLVLDYETGAVTRELTFPSYHDEWQNVSGKAEATGALAISPDGSWLALGTRSGHLHRWDLNQGEARATSWEAHSEPVRQIAFTNDGKLLHSLSREGVLCAWAVDTAQLVHSTSESDGKIDNMVAFSNEELLAWQAGDNVSVYDPMTFTRLENFTVSRPTLAAASSPELASLGPGDLALRRMQHGRAANEHSLPLANKERTFSPDGRLLAEVSRGSRYLKLWDLANERIAVTEVVPLALHCVAFHPTGKLLAIPAEDRTYIHEVRNSPVQDVVGLQPDNVLNLAFGRGGETLWTMSKRRLSEGAPAGWAGEWPVHSSDRRDLLSQWLVGDGYSSNDAVAFPNAMHPNRDLLVCASNESVWCRAEGGVSQVAIGKVESVYDL